MEIVYFLAAVLTVIIFGKPFINRLRILKFGQEIRREGPQSHLKKAGTPTMGGIIFILFVTVISVIYGIIAAADFKIIAFVIISSLLYGYTGFIDDYAKIKKKDNEGLTAKQKYAIQFLIAIIMIIGSKFLLKIDTEIIVPLLNKTVDLRWIYYPLVILMCTGATNGVNLSDGLDGLCAGVSAVVMIGLAILAGNGGNDEIRYMSFIMSGALFGFLYYNFNPAKIFMGDTGSLFIGGFLSAAFMVMKMPFHLVILGLYYVVETVSVILQVIYFKRTGKRLFKMAPIHHHFELKGYSEKTVVLSSYLATCFIVLLTVLIG